MSLVNISENGQNEGGHRLVNGTSITCSFSIVDTCFALVQELVQEGGLHPNVRAFINDLKQKLPSLRQGGGGLAKPPDPAAWGRGITHSMPFPMHVQCDRQARMSQ